MRYGEEEGGAGYHFTDIKTSPLAGYDNRLPSQHAAQPETLRVGFIVCVYRLIHFSSGLMQNKVTVQKWRTRPYKSRYCFLFTFSASLSLIIREWGGTISSIQTWPSGLSSSALTTSEWYDGLYHPVGGSTNYVTYNIYLFLKHTKKSIIIHLLLLSYQISNQSKTTPENN